MNIKVVQDLICPWCYIGHHNLNQAIAGWTTEHDRAVELQWLPYQLDPIEPGAPRQGFRERFMERKNITAEQMDAMFDRVTQAGAALGIAFRFDRITVAVDTLPGHVAIVAAPLAKQGVFVNALHRAYFEDGKDIGLSAEILAAATVAGLTGEEQSAVADALADEAAHEKTGSHIRQVMAAGVSGVPYFVIDNKLGLSGGQPVEVFRQALDQVHQPALA